MCRTFKAKECALSTQSYVSVVHFSAENGFSINIANSDLKQVSLQVLNVVMLLKDACGGHHSDFSQEEIQRMIGILKTNGMKLGIAKTNFQSAL